LLKNAYLVAKISADTAEKEQRFASILPIPHHFADGVGSTARTAPSAASPAVPDPAPGAQPAPEA